MEGGVLGHVQRVMEGKPLYPEPSPEFIPFIYTPLFYYVSAAFTSVLGYGLFPVRLVSFLATWVTAGLIAQFVRYECRSPLFGILSASVYLGTCAMNADWFDMARIDSLAVAITLGGAYLVRSARSRRRLVVGGVLAGLAFLAKQSALAVVPALALYALLRFRWRGLLAFVLPLLAVLGASTWALQSASGGWYWYYIIELPSNHAFADSDLVQNFWRFELPQQLPIALGCAALYFFGYPSGKPRVQLGFYLPLTLCLLLGSWASRNHAGSHVNDLMPAHAAVALLSGLALAGWARAELPYTWSRRKVACCLAAAAQLALLFRDPTRILPTVTDVEAGNDLVQRIRNTPGEVLVANHPHLAVLAGKPAYGHRMAHIDIYLGRRDLRGVRNRLRAAWAERFARKQFALVILDDDGYEFLEELKQHYDRIEDLGLPPRALLPKSGIDVRPTLVFQPKQ
jgi:4-amino-4-deoxy-L-arabinose transferase-like glycosyltransferase